MNDELLDKLSEQAVEYAISQYGKQRKGERVWYPSIQERKFAELIVQEIIKLIQPNEEWRHSASWGYLAGEEGVELMDGAVRTIKEHFGLQS